MAKDSDITIMSKIAHDLTMLQHQQATGELLIQQNQQDLSQSQSQCHLYFYIGRLVYATGSYHRVRRWYRVIRQHCPRLIKDSSTTQIVNGLDPWEANLLADWVKQEKISMSQVRAVVQSSVREVFFGFIDQSTLTTTWVPGKQTAQHMAFLSTEQVMQDAYQLRDRWRSAGLVSATQKIEQFSPDAAPVLIHPAQLQKQVAPETFQNLKLLLTGKNTMWDIAQQMQASLPAVTRAFLPLLEQGIIDLEELPDLPSPVAKLSKPAVPKVASPASIETAAKPANTSYNPSSKPPSPTVAKPEARPLIVCIDDSPMIGQQMQVILEPAGYEMLHILDPLKGIATLLNRKPALIFLDLVMPNSNGYELCTFLRKTTAFRETPIVILTGHDGVIDRVRAKMAGSSDFLSKPPVPSKVLMMIQKHIPDLAITKKY